MSELFLNDILHHLCLIAEVGKCLVHVQDGRAVLGQSRALAGLQSRLHSRDIRKELLVVQLPM